MRSGSIRVLAGCVALSMLSGCMFMQWTDHAFIGSPQDPPTHANREWAGAVIMPAAIIGDIISAPIQLIALLVSDDYGIYARPRERAGLAIDAQQLRVAALDADGNLTEIALTPEQRTELASRLSDGSFDVAGAQQIALR